MTSSKQDAAPLEPWQWPEPHWRKLVNQVRAGKAYRPASWKGGARCAFALSFDADHETNELRDGGKSIGRMAWGEYGTRVGVPRFAAVEHARVRLWRRGRRGRVHVRLRARAVRGVWLQAADTAQALTAPSRGTAHRRRRRGRR